MNHRPNFLLVSADQQRGDCLGVEGRWIGTLVSHLSQRIQEAAP